jgi:mannan polymerase II complex MNN11 subunit
MLVFFMTTSSELGSEALPVRRAPIPLLMVLVVNNETHGDRQRPAYLDAVIANRQAYADRHGYRFIIKDAARIRLTAISPTPDQRAHESWLKLYALREVAQDYPEVEWIWYLDPEALIMDQTLSLTEDIIKPSVLTTLILRDVAITPPDGIIKTTKQTDMSKIHFILSHDQRNLNTHSFLIRSSEFSKYLLETWYDPLYRTYNFDKAAVSAIEHILHWHYTILEKTALVPKRLLSSYINAAGDMGYKEGDFVLYFEGCSDAGRSCEHEMDRWHKQISESSTKAGVAPVAG